MVGPARPQFVLFGSSIVQLSFGVQGWGAILADLYSRKADVLLRGYNGWNSRQAVRVLDQVFPKDSVVQPSLVIVYFGGNDSVKPHAAGLSPDLSPDLSPHVPLAEYIENMRKIAIHLKNLSAKTRVIFLSVLPVNEAKICDAYGTLRRTNDDSQTYSDACIRLCQEMDVKVIDLWTALQKRDDWLTACFTEDGIHLTHEGSKMVAKEILKALKEVHWEPSLEWELLPTEYAEIMDDPRDLVLRTTTNKSFFECLLEGPL